MSCIMLMLGAHKHITVGNFIHNQSSKSFLYMHKNENLTNPVQTRNEIPIVFRFFNWISVSLIVIPHLEHLICIFACYNYKSFRILSFMLIAKIWWLCI